MLDKLLLVDEGYQTGGLPGQGTPVQVDVKVQGEILEELRVCLGKLGIGFREETNALGWHNAEQLLERGAWHVYFTAVVINFELLYNDLPLQQILHYVLVQV